jgi:NAD(P)-dependent dehydrogenase (short-subunit alcohol dehydrogenase family)
VITGGDSGIGRAAAIAYAREGADVLIAYLNEDEDAAEVARIVEDADRKCVLVRGDLAEPAHCRAVIDRAAAEFGGIDVLVSNAAFQMTHSDLTEISDQEWDYTFRLNVGAYFYLVKAALPHMGPGSSVIGSSSVNSDMPSPTLAPYAATKAAIANFSASLAQLLGEKGIRVNSVAPGPIWTPLIPATMPEEKVANFGDDTPLGRAGQPAELAPVYVLLASDEGSYISVARVAVTAADPCCERVGGLSSQGPGEDRAGEPSARPAGYAHAAQGRSRGCDRIRRELRRRGWRLGSRGTGSRRGVSARPKPGVGRNISC